MQYTGRLCALFQAAGANMDLSLSLCSVMQHPQNAGEYDDGLSQPQTA